MSRSVRTMYVQTILCTIYVQHIYLLLYLLFYNCLIHGNIQTTRNVCIGIKLVHGYMYGLTYRTDVMSYLDEHKF